MPENTQTPERGPGRAITLMIFGVLVVAAVGVFLQQTVFRSVRVKGTKRAPEVSFQLENGDTVSLDQYRGKVVLLNFWASWCPPCVKEIPDLERLSRLMARRDEFVIVGASQDDTWDDLQAAADKFGVTFDVVWDPRGRGALAFGTNKLPETYLLDRDGKIVQKWIGYQPWSTPAFVKRFEQVLDAGGRGTEQARAAGAGAN